MLVKQKKSYKFRVVKPRLGVLLQRPVFIRVIENLHNMYRDLYEQSLVVACFNKKQGLILLLWLLNSVLVKGLLPGKANGCQGEIPCIYQCISVSGAAIAIPAGWCSRCLVDRGYPRLVLWQLCISSGRRWGAGWAGCG